VVERQARGALVGELVDESVVMPVRFRTLLLIACIAGASARGLAADPPAAPVTNLGSPEAALRSYWALIDWREALRRSRTPDAAETSYHRMMIEVTAGRTQKFYQSIQALAESDRQTKLERKIISTTQESAQRAVVLANIRNVTPIPPGAKPGSPSLAQRRQKGEDYKYVLTLDGSQWKVLEVWSLFMGSRQLYGQAGPDYPVYVPPQ